jgi:hypothetical protein
MDHEKRGRAIIFNHKKYNASLNLTERSGTDTDKIILKQRIEKLKFYVDVYDDLLLISRNIYSRFQNLTTRMKTALLLPCFLMGEKKASCMHMMTSTRQVGSLASKIDANRKKMKADREERKVDDQAKAAQEMMERQIKAIVHSTQSERDVKIQRRSENITERQEIPKEVAAVARLECEDQGPKELESGVERREVPKEEVTEKSSSVTKKRPRG